MTATDPRRDRSPTTIRRRPPTAADWVFRHAGGCLIEVPPLSLPIPPPPGTVLRAWVSTLWRDATRLDGWARLDWPAADRGWQLPRHLAIGDVIEFGLAAVNLAEQVPAGWDRRWYGWLRYCTDLAAVVVGPYPHPADTAAAASATIDEIRLAQLAPPKVDDAPPPPLLVDDHRDSDP